MPVALLLLLTAAALEILGHSFDQGSASRSEAHSTGGLTIRALAPADRMIIGAEFTVGALLALDEDPPPPPTHPELSTKTRAGFDTVQLRENYQDCVRSAVRKEPARPPSATFSSLLASVCGNEAEALRAAILRREKASPVATRLADEAVAEATNTALQTIRIRDEQ